MSQASPLLTPRTRTFRRARKLLLGHYSLLRNLEYEALQNTPEITGRALDVGGGRKNTYHHLLRAKDRIESINIDPAVDPTYIADLNYGMPMASETYDVVLSMNTFEHIRDDQLAICESIRVLKHGGMFCFSIPFLYRVHGSPFDFHRHTALWWSHYLARCGADPMTLQVDPLVWDRATTAYSFYGATRAGKLLGIAVGLRSVLRDRLVYADRLPDTVENRRVADYALGYFITGRKI